MPKDAVVRLYRSVRRRRLPSSKGAGQGKQQEEEEEGGVVRLTLLGKARPLPFFTDQPTRTMAERRIFVSTYNMAECSLDALGGARALAAWVPLGADVYVIGVQECMAYEALGQALLAHMGPEYVMFSKAIGSTQTTLGYHGLIAIWVLAKAKVRTICFEEADSFAKE